MIDFLLSCVDTVVGLVFVFILWAVTVLGLRALYFRIFPRKKSDLDRLL